ncbi:MAG: dihydropteroate synthase [Dokdonella sp.]|jgi:dihydropteroate synthase|nr:MAG: dihydropteroate synthase [Dokdonella sp.]
MGILNVTPDSFSDGGRFDRPDAAVARAETMAAEGAPLIDIGGESTRPGAAPVDVEEETRRVVPVVAAVARRLPGVWVSIDTSKAEVARRALDAGARLVNDVSALSDPAMATVLHEHRAPAVLMHRRGDPRTMQDNPVYTDVIAAIASFFEERLAFAAAHGLPRTNFLLDPGLGFGKTTAHNLTILRRLGEFQRFGLPLLIGASRKSFIGRALGGETTPLPPADREEGSLAAALWAAAKGARVLRVHDVRAAARALTLWRALAG